MLEPKFRSRNFIIEHSLLYQPHGNRSYMDVANVMQESRSHIWLLIVSPNHYELLCALYKYGHVTGSKYLAFAYMPSRDDSWWFPPATCSTIDKSAAKCDYLYKNECSDEEILSVLRGTLLLTTYDTNIADVPIDVVGLRPTQFRDDMQQAVGSQFSASEMFSLYLYNQFDAVTAAVIALDRTEKFLRERYNSTLAYFRYNDTRMVNTAMEVLENLTFQGLSGRIGFSAAGDRTGVDWAIQQFQGTFSAHCIIIDFGFALYGT